VKARAPGKVVISGAYAVLYGAPALVSAVDRYVLVDSERPAELVTPEVRAALGAAPAPWFDSSALRGARGKLGLGSSAAIVVASLYALACAGGRTESPELAREILRAALIAHRSAQAGGSGIDVAVSTLGGTLLARRRGEELELEPVSLPERLVFEVWAGGEPASTSELTASVARLAREAPTRFDSVMAPLRSAAESAAQAARSADAESLVAALALQSEGLAKLGDCAGVPIVTREVADLFQAARSEAAVVLPSGAGGGDIALFVGERAPSLALCKLRSELGHERIPLSLGARGVHLAEPP